MKKFSILNFQFSNKAGFTLVETLVAISIFSVSLIGLMNVLGSGISNTNYAKKKMTATYLAQEGIEYVRNLRDTYVLYSATPAAGWTAFVNKLTAATCDNQSYGCYFDDQTLDFTNPNKPVTNIPFYSCSAPSCPQMYYNPSYSKYNYLTGSAAGFVRTIKLTQVNANEVKITSIVYWGQGSGTYNISFSENLFNWVE